MQPAYRELDLTSNRQQDHLLPLREFAAAVGARDLPDAATGKEVWSWLAAVATWLNHEYVGDVADVMLPCWPQYPHLLHEIAILADQRHRAGQALTSDALEEWPGSRHPSDR